MYLHVDLCCGLGWWQAPFEESEDWRTVGVDIRKDLEADVVGDVSHLPLRPCEPTLVTASPPCPEYTTWQLPWFPDETPDLRPAAACFRAVEYLRPDHWVLENVRGFDHFWGDPVKKWGPWYLWGDFPPCDPGPVVYKEQNQTPHAGVENATIPYPLADAVRQAVETWA